MKTETEIREILRQATKDAREASQRGMDINYELGFIRAMRDVLGLKDGEET